MVLENNYSAALEKVKGEINEINGQLKTTAEQIVQISNGLAAISSVKGGKGDVNTTIKQQQDEYDKLNKKIKEQTALENKKQQQINSLFNLRQKQIQKEIDAESKKQAQLKNTFALEERKLQKQAELAQKQYQKEIELNNKRIQSAQQKAERLVAIEERKAKRIADIEAKWSRTGSSSTIPGMSAKISDLKAREKEAEATKKADAALKEYSRSYNDLVRKQQAAKKVLQDSIVTYGASSKQTRAAQKEFDVYNKKVGEANKATSNFAKGGLGQAISGFRNLLGAFGIVGGIQMFANIVTSSYEVIKAFDSLNYAFEKVITNEGELARTQGFLIDLSKKYGVELLATSEKYLKFYVASKNANVATKDIEETFRTFTEAGATLGLSTDKMNRIFTALEQMMSKGTVSSEELRQQLGDSLPAAFELMAKGLGVTTGELQKMLKAGDVVAKDAVPKLAQAIKEFYKLNGEGIDSIQSASGKLATSWQQLITTISGSDWWKSVLKGLAAVTNGLVDLAVGVEGVNISESFSRRFKWLQDESNMSLEQAKKELAETRDIVSEMVIQKAKLEGIGKWKESDDVNLGEYKGKAKALNAYIKLLKQKDADEQKALATSIQIMSNEIELTDVQLDKFSTIKKGSKDQYKSLEELRKIQQELMDLTSKEKENTIPWYEEKIKANEKLRDTLKDTNSEDMKKVDIINKQNKEYQRRIDLLKGKEDKDDKDDKEKIKLAEKYLDSKRALNKAELEEAMNVQEDIYSNEKVYIDDRLKAYEEYNRLKKLLISSEFVFEKQQLEADLKNKEITQETFDNKIKELKIKRDRELLDSDLKLADDQLKLRKDAFDDILKETQDYFNKEQERIETEAKTKEIALRADGKTEKDITAELEAWKQAEMKKSLLAYIDVQEKKAKARALANGEEFQDAVMFQKMRNEINATGKSVEEVTEKLKDFMREFGDTFFSEAGFDFTGKILQDWDEFTKMLDATPDADKWKVYFNTIAEVAQETMNFIAENTQKNFDAEVKALETQRDIAIQFAGEGDAAKKQIEEQYEARRKEIQIRQWKAEQRLAMSNILINTAQAVVATLGKTGFFGIPLAAIVGGIGAAQLALVATQKVPEFKDGVRNFEGGIAIVGDGGRREVVETSRGSWLTPNTDTLVNLPKGANVYKSEDDYINNILKQNDIYPYKESAINLPMITSDRGMKASEMDSILGKHFRNIQTNNINFDENGVVKFVSKGNSKTVLLNNRVTFKGINV